MAAMALDHDDGHDDRQGEEDEYDSEGEDPRRAGVSGRGVVDELSGFELGLCGLLKSALGLLETVPGLLFLVVASLAVTPLAEPGGGR